MNVIISFVNLKSNLALLSNESLEMVKIVKNVKVVKIVNCSKSGITCGIICGKNYGYNTLCYRP